MATDTVQLSRKIIKKLEYHTNNDMQISTYYNNYSGVVIFTVKYFATGVIHRYHTTVSDIASVLSNWIDDVYKNVISFYRQYVVFASEFKQKKTVDTMTLNNIINDELWLSNLILGSNKETQLKNTA